MIPVSRHNKRRSAPDVTRINRLNPVAVPLSEHLRTAEADRALLERLYDVVQECVEDGVEFDEQELELIDTVGLRIGKKSRH